MCKDMAMHLIRGHGVDPSWLGRKAHRILAQRTSESGELWIKTPRHGWHKAKNQPVNRKPRQLSLAI